MKIGIIAALPGELKPLVRGWARLPVLRGSGIEMWQRSHGEDEIVAVCAGMGTKAALRAFTAAEHAGSLDLVLSIGWCGAMVDSFTAPHCYLISQIIDTQTGERFSALTGPRQLRLVTTPDVVGEQEKKRLHETYSAGMVDMEAATVARLARMRDIPLVCIKAVSDNIDARLPDLNPFISDQGQLRMGQFLAHVAVHPQYWSSLLQMGKSTRAAANRLAAAVELFLQTKSAGPLLKSDPGESILCTG